jgi:RNA polymerase sigma factor (sigma-70 family)
MDEVRIKRFDADGVLSGPNIERYSSLLHAYLMRRLRRSQDAQDLTQEIFTRFIRKCRDDPQTVRDPLAFLLGIAGNVVRESRYSTQHTRVTFDSSLADEATDAADGATRTNTAEQIGMREDILHAITKLPENYLTAWLLVDGEELSYEEAARASGFSRNTISAYVAIARAKLKLILDDYWASKDRQK